MQLDPHAMPKVLQLYLELNQYPILQRRIRQLMRLELFQRGVVSPELFEAEVREKAIQSQRREGMDHPEAEEPPDTWQLRVEKIRDDLTDFYFAYNLHHDLFKDLVEEVVTERAPDREFVLSFNPEMAPWALLFAQAEEYERTPPEKRASVEHHLREIIVVLIKAMISDQLGFVRVAREYFDVEDLKEIRKHRFGRGKIGGKSAGMLLAYKVLQNKAPEYGIDASDIRIPESWYIGSDVYYDFHANNELFQHMNQKYKRHEDMLADYPKIYREYLSCQLPDYILWHLADLLETLGPVPLIVRSSSLLEDNIDTSFAGKYDSFFLPNQGTPEENLHDLHEAVIKVYSSVIRPDVLIYRDRMGLVDYDERMAVLIQKVEGRQNGRYFFPDLAGVGFSYNPYAWSERIRREDGLLRLVVGLGTRAVNRVGSDYPRMVALSHPTLRPEWGSQMLRRYSQHMIDVIDLEENQFVTVPITDVIDVRYPALNALVSIDHDGYVKPLVSRPLNLDPAEMVVTFDNLLAQDQFTGMLRDSLHILQEAYEHPVDVEFAGEVIETYPKPVVRLALLQCRGLSSQDEGETVEIPDDLPEEDIVFSANQQIPRGCVEGIDTIIFIDPRSYARIPDPHTRVEIGRVVGRLNYMLNEATFILMGPGRWGTSNIQLGVKVTYADIFNTKVLIEIAYAAEGSVPEVSYGTHFFQDLVEANIYPLPLYPDDENVIFNQSFFDSTPNKLSAILPDESRYAHYVKVIDIPAVSNGRTMTIIMNSEEQRAVAFLTD